jgi:recombination protein RecA
MRRTTETPEVDLVDQITQTKRIERKSTIIDSSKLIPTGSTLLNCACSDNPEGGFGLGKLVNLIGDSSAGKTLLALTTLAEVSQLRRFKDYRLIFDDAEHALEFDLSYLLGSKAAKRIEPPQGTRKKPVNSEVMETLQANVLNALKRGDPFIYVIDSFDALDTEEGEKKAYLKALRAAKTETQAKEIKSVHKARKAGHATELFRLVSAALKKSDSTLIVVSQVRDLVGGTGFGPRKTRSGGRALKFYSTHEMWMVITGREKRKKREVGINADVKVSKNKLTGKVRTVPVTIWYDYGIDDLSRNIDFLIEEDYWRKKKDTIIAEDLAIEATKRSLIAQIEEDRLEGQVRELVGKVWNEIEESLKVDRKPRYG